MASNLTTCAAWNGASVCGASLAAVQAIDAAVGAAIAQMAPDGPACVESMASYWCHLSMPRCQQQTATSGSNLQVQGVPLKTCEAAYTSCGTEEQAPTLCHACAGSRYCPVYSDPTPSGAVLAQLPPPASPPDGRCAVASASSLQFCKQAAGRSVFLNSAVLGSKAMASPEDGVAVAAADAMASLHVAQHGDPTQSPSCLSAVRALACAMFLPECEQGRPKKLCHATCVDAARTCNASMSASEAAAQCSASPADFYVAASDEGASCGYGDVATDDVLGAHVSTPTASAFPYAAAFGGAACGVVLTVLVGGLTAWLVLRRGGTNSKSGVPSAAQQRRTSVSAIGGSAEVVHVSNPIAKPHEAQGV